MCIRQFNLQKKYGKKNIQNQSKVRLRRTGKSTSAQPTGGGGDSWKEHRRPAGQGRGVR